jgi:nucleoside 2-deoxyribosyltransferase
VSRIYIAAPYEMREEAISIMHWLESQGHEVTSSWLCDGAFANDDPTARLDLADIDRADLLLALNPSEWRQRGTGGRHFEIGYAMKAGKQIVLIGVRTNVFHHMDCVRVIERIEEL